MKNKVCVFVDVSNQFYNINKKWPHRKLNYKVYFEVCKKYGEVTRAFAYGTQVERAASKFISCLHHIGYEPNFREVEPNNWYCWDVGLTIEIVNQIIHKRCDAIIIGSTNRVLIQTINWAKAQGIRVIVVACGINNEIRETCEWEEIDKSMLENIIEKEESKDAVTETT